MAVAAVTRIAVVATDVDYVSSSAMALSWLPVVAWSVAGLALIPAVRRRREIADSRSGHQEIKP